MILIKASDPLAELFNFYLQSLELHSKMYDPGLHSMHSLHERIESTEPGIRSQAYQTVVNTYRIWAAEYALQELHMSVMHSIERIEVYLNEHQADWKDYAITCRRERLTEEGTLERNTAELFNTDPDSLLPYTLHTGLTFYIGANYRQLQKPGVIVGEGVGSSRPEHFEPLTTWVRQKTEFDFQQFYEAMDIPIEKRTPNPDHFVDRVQRKIRADLANGQMCDLFDAVILKGWHIRERFEQLRPDANHEQDYRQILKDLYQILKLEFDI